MLPLERPVLDKRYAALWAGHIVWLFGMLVFFPPLWVMQLHLGVFALVEGTAVAAVGRAGDTLSELMQWIVGKTPSRWRVRWWQGWKAFVTLIAALYSLEGAYVVWHGAGPFVAVPVGIMVFLWLQYHWGRREKFG